MIDLRLQRLSAALAALPPSARAAMECNPLRLARGLNIVAGVLLCASSFGCLPFNPSAAVALVLLALSLQFTSGHLFRAMPITAGFTLAIVITYGTVRFMQGDGGTLGVAEAGSLSLKQLLAGELWRVPTSVLLHRDWDHASGNAMWLFGLGLVLEPALGTRRFAGAILLCLATSTAAGVVLSGGGYGASGITYGLHGVILARPFRTTLGGRRSLDGAWFVAAWLMLISSPDTPPSPEVGVTAHLGGLIGGLWFGTAWAKAESVTHGHARARRVVTCAATTVCLIAALAMSPRWAMEWHANTGRLAELRGDHGSADHHWGAIEDLASPSEPFDAAMLCKAAKYWARRGESQHGIRIMVAVAPMLGSVGYRDLGLFQAYAERCDERAALETWRQSLALDACQPEVLDFMAQVYLFPRDTTLYSPLQARALAWCAVSQDDFRSPELLETLSNAFYYSGYPDYAVRWMQVAIERGPDQRDRYEKELVEMRKDLVQAG